MLTLKFVFKVYCDSGEHAKSILVKLDALARKKIESVMREALIECAGKI